MSWEKLLATILLLMVRRREGVEDTIVFNLIYTSPNSSKSKARARQNLPAHLPELAKFALNIYCCRHERVLLQQRSDSGIGTIAVIPTFIHSGKDETGISNYVCMEIRSLWKWHDGVCSGHHQFIISTGLLDWCYLFRFSLSETVAHVCSH
jgi:hypothetical protein